MNNLSFTEQQYAALELSKEAAKELIEFSKYQLLSLLKSDLSYAEIVSQLLPWHNITKKATASTRRWALLIALSDLKKTEIFTQEELAPYIQKRKSQWWKKSVQNLYHVHGTIPLSDQEKELLVELQLSNPFLKSSLKHKKDDVKGVQFHPESIMTEYGMELLGNWLNKDK